MSFLIFGLMAVFFAAGFGFGMAFERWRSYPERRPAMPYTKQYRREDIANLRKDVRDATEALTPKTK